MNTKQYFADNQKEMLRFLNTEGGRFLLGVDKNPIIQITPNSVHQLMDFREGKPVIWAKFYTREVFNEFIPTFDKLAILKDEWRRKYDPYKAFLNYSGLERYKNLPQIYLTTTNFNTNAGGDGGMDSHDSVWATARNGPADTLYDSNTTVKIYAEYADAYYIARLWMPTDTSGLTASATISAANFNHYVTAQNVTPAYEICTVQGSQTTATDLVIGDWANIGATEGATRVSSVTTSAYKVIALNATGLTWISKTGYTHMAFRMGRDLDNSAPAASAAITEITVNTGDAASNKPYLDVTYTLPETAGGNFFQFMQ